MTGAVPNTACRTASANWTVLPGPLSSPTSSSLQVQQPVGPTLEGPLLLQSAWRQAAATAASMAAQGRQQQQQHGASQHVGLLVLLMIPLRWMMTNKMQTVRVVH